MGAALLNSWGHSKAQDKGSFMPHHDAAPRPRLSTLKVLLTDRCTLVNEGVHDSLAALTPAAAAKHPDAPESIHWTISAASGCFAVRTTAGWASSWLALGPI